MIYSGIAKTLGVVATSVAILCSTSTVSWAKPHLAPSIRSTDSTRVFQAGLSYGDTLVWMSDGDLAAALDDARAVHAGWIRADLSWDNIQNDGPEWFQWQLFDRVVKAASARGLAVLPVLAYTPPWARPAGCDSHACAPADPARFAAFAQAAARRYAPMGIHTWEIWNEQNTTGFWKPSPSPEAYTTLLKATSQAIKGVDPSARLVLGGLASKLTSGGNFSQADFLASVSALGGNRLVDAIGYHPYTYPYLPSATTSFRTAWEKMASSENSLRSVLTTYGTPDLPIWLTEYGAPTGGPGTASDGSPATIGPTTTHVTEAHQARIATDAVKTAAADPYVKTLFWYADRDLGTDPSSSENFYGIRRADGSAKPAFQALSDAIAIAAPASGTGSKTPALRRSKPRIR